MAGVDPILPGKIQYTYINMWIKFNLLWTLIFREKLLEDFKTMGATHQGFCWSSVELVV